MIGNLILTGNLIYIGILIYIGMLTDPFTKLAFLFILIYIIGAILAIAGIILALKYIWRSFHG